MQKRIVFLLVYALIMSCILNMTYASDATTSHNIVDKITIKKENGEIGEFGLYERLYIHINWSAKRPLVKDEVYQIELPSEFKEKDTKIKILYGGDKEVGICEVKDNILFITFNEEVESIRNAKGEIILVRELKYEYYKEGESKLEFTFTSAEKSWKVNVEFNVDKPANDEVIMKYGFSAYDEQGNEKLYWRQRINFNKQNLKQVVVEDRLGEGQKINRASLKVIKGEDLYDIFGDYKYDAEFEEVDINSLNPIIKDDYFRFELGDISCQYCIIYNVDFTRELDVYKNEATVFWDNGSWQIWGSQEVFSFDEAYLEGERFNGSVQLIKVDKKDHSKRLGNAKFALYNSENTRMGEYYTTTGSGIYIFGLKPDNYRFIEEQAPAGYQLDPTPILFTIRSRDEETCMVYAYNFPIENSVDPKPPTDPEPPVDPKPPTDPEPPVDPKPPTDPEPPVDPKPPTDPEPPVELLEIQKNIKIDQSIESDEPIKSSHNRVIRSKNILPQTGYSLRWEWVVMFLISGMVIRKLNMRK